MSAQENSFGRISPTAQLPIIPKYKPKHDKNTVKTSDKPSDKNGRNSPSDKTGRNSPSKFVFTLYPNKEKHNKTNHKHNHIKPILTMKELESNHDRSISISPTSNGPLSISPTSNGPKKFRHRHFRSNSNSPPTISPPTISPPTISPKYTIKPIVHSEEINIDDINIDDINKGDMNEKSISITNQVSNIQRISYIDRSVKVFNKFEYYTKSQLIHMIKHLVYQHSALICGSFNTHQLTINEHTKSFMYQIKNYQQINNINLTDTQINDFFINDLVLPESKQRLNLQTSIDILISHSNFINFILNLKTYFNTPLRKNYKLEYINKGNIVYNNGDTNTIEYYNTNGNKIYLHVVKIFEETYNISFEINFIILHNDKTILDKSYIIPLVIPFGLYDTENLYITNNGLNDICMQHSSSSLTYILNNINMNILSIMPKINDPDYTKLALYILQIMSVFSNTTYLFEFDIFNTIHKKSDFWLTNKITENNCHGTNSTDTTYSIDVLNYTNYNKCTKCTINITKNSKYVISKCCNKEYHIECMEMNYYVRDYYMYLVCDCGCAIIDENSCNDKLLHALYKHYY